MNNSRCVSKSQANRRFRQSGRKLARRAPPQMLRIIGICSAAVLLVVFGCAILLLQNLFGHKDDVVATVNGYAITSRELHTFCQATSTQLGTDGVLTKAIQSAAREKLIQIDACKAGLTRTVSYGGFLAAMKNENAGRLKSSETGQIVYGVPQYTETEYYSYITNSLKQNLENALLQQHVITASQQNLQAFYEANKNTYAKGQDDISLEIISFPSTQEGVKEMNSIYKDVNGGKNFDAVFKQYNQKTGRKSTQTMEINQKTSYNIAKYQSELYNSASKLAAGKMSVVTDDLGGDSILLIYCTARHPSGYQSLSDVMDEITLRYEDSKFDQYIDSQLSKAKITIRKDAAKQMEDYML